MWGVEKCGKVYGVSGEVCWREGEGCGGGVVKCVREWDPNTLPPTLSHISSITSLPSPFLTSPLTSPTPQHTFLHFLSYLFPHLPFLPPHPNTLSYAYSHVGRGVKSPIKFFTNTGNLKSCFGVGNVNFQCMKVWRSYHVAKLL